MIKTLLYTGESYTSLNKLAYAWSTQSTQSVKMVVPVRLRNRIKQSVITTALQFALKLRNTCRRNLTQWLVSWSNPVVSEALFETRTMVAKGQKMGRAEAIHTWVVHFQRYYCLSVSVCSVGTWGKSILLILKMTLAVYCPKYLQNRYLFMYSLRQCRGKAAPYTPVEGALTIRRGPTVVLLTGERDTNLPGKLN